MSRGFGASFAAENQLSHSFQQLESDTLSEHGGAASSSSRRIDSRGASAFSRGRDDAGSGMDIHEDDLLAEFRPVKDTLNKVNWSGMALTSLPVFKSNQLEAQVMWINNNKIVALPTSIKMLSNLRTLRLDDNQIQIIPGFLASCRWLECLTAKRNKIHQISLDVFDLQNIKVLDFEENSLTVLPEVHNFHLLERLSVTKNRLTKLPSSIGSCSRLKSLYADNNRIQQLMFTFEQLTDLQLLNIAHNEISAVHSSIGCCLSLEVLHLHYNHLITLPYTVGLLSNLSRLTIHDNPSVSVPKQVIAAGTDIAVDFLKKMLDANESKQIWLNNMHLITVPLPNVSQVQEFVVWKRIRVLNLDRNELHNLPVELCVLDELEVLSVEHNMLTTVTPTLMQLSRLQVLAVGNNRIQSLPQSLKKLIQLEELLFETNCLTVVPTMLPSLISLTDLRFDNNRIASLPPELGNLQMLQILSFQNNVVDSIPPSFTSLHRLAYLRCGSNKIADIHLDLCCLTPWSAENAVAKNKSLSFLIYSSQSKEQRLAGVRKKLIGQRKSHRTQGGSDSLSTNAYSGWKLVSFTLFGEQGPNLPFRDKYGRKLSERELMNRDLDGEEAEQLAAEIASQEAAAEQAAIAEALGKEEAAKVAAAEAGPAVKPVGFFDKLMKLVKGDDVQPLAPDAPAAVETKEADGAEKKKNGAAPEEPQEMSFVEKLALKVAKLTGSVPVEVVFQEKDADEMNTLDSGVALSSLTRLELGSNQLTSLPKTFGNLSVLITLNLSRNALNKLPTQVLSLSGLKTLIVSNNTLSDLPKQLGALQNLRHLDASFNSIIAVPQSIAVCLHMQTLSLQHNSITELPQALFLLTNLTVLSVNHNPLSIFDEDFAMLQKLRRLLINHTQIKRIPSTVEYMQSLREIYVNDTLISNIPDELAGLQNLQLLVLSQGAISDNRLRELRRRILGRKVLFV